MLVIERMLNNPKLTSLVLFLMPVLANLARLAKTLWSTFRLVFIAGRRLENQMDCIGLEQRGGEGGLVGSKLTLGVNSGRQSVCGDDNTA